LFHNPHTKTKPTLFKKTMNSLIAVYSNKQSKIKRYVRENNLFNCLGKFKQEFYHFRFRPNLNKSKISNN